MKIYRGIILILVGVVLISSPAQVYPVRFEESLGARRVRNNDILQTVGNYKTKLTQNPNDKPLLGSLIEHLKSNDPKKALTAALVLIEQRSISEEERLEAIKVIKDYYELFLDKPLQYQGMVDFHIHSFWSDAMATPSELVFDAWINGMKAITVLNHNTFDGVWESLCAGEILGIQIVPGIELDLSFESLGIDNMHVVAYFDNDSNTFQKWFLDIEDDPTMQMIDGVYQTYVDYGRRMIDAFNERRFIAEDESGEVLVLTEEDLSGRIGEMIIRYRLTEALFDKYGPEKLGGDDIMALSKKYFNIKLGTHFGRSSLPATEVIPFIVVNGGVLVIPHPTELTDRYGYQVLEQLLKDYAVIEVGNKRYFGFRGIEINSLKTTLDRRGEYLDTIEMFNATHPVYTVYPLIITSGSDWHYHFGDFNGDEVPFIQDSDGELDFLLQQLELVAEGIPE